MEQDKEIERRRFDDRAVDLLGKETQINEQIHPALWSPYEHYIREITEYQSSQPIHILEIAAGTGAYTGWLLKKNAQVSATDISEHALQVAAGRHASSRLQLTVCDMERLPYPSDHFHLVTIAGALSYGDHQRVMREVYRVLAVGGRLIVVDSLNHNFIYRFNRWVHYLRGNRTISTLIRMPTLELIEKYRECFGEVEVNFFGAISWMLPLLHRVLGEARAAIFSDWFDQWLNVKKSAFKFVMVARKIR